MVMMAETANDMVLNSHADRGRFSREFELVGNLVVYLMGIINGLSYQMEFKWNEVFPSPLYGYC